MIKHTAGPWKGIKFEGEENYVITTEAGTPGMHREIATVPFGFTEPAETEQHANAKLLAAAPQLLASLRELHKDIEEWARDFGYCDRGARRRASELLSRLDAE